MEFSRTGRGALAAATCAFATLMGIVPLLPSAKAAEADPRPNIIVIQTDDQDAPSMSRAVMPHVAKLLREPGTTFTDYVVSGPLCCPSRAVMLTGQYGHNNGVLWNGATSYTSMRDKDNTLPVWLQRAGYRTAHVGKYLNGYGVATGDPNEVPPGWEEWHSVLEQVDYYDYTLRENGEIVQYGTNRRDYLTHVLNDEAVEMIRRYVPARRPLFLMLDHYAPHHSDDRWNLRCRRTAVPAPRDLHLFEGLPIPRPASFNEGDVRDKPGYVAEQAPLTAKEIRRLKRHYRCRLASLRAVDRGVGRIHRALRKEGELGQTAILFTSDNGWIQGPHRIPGRKIAPYEEVLHAPFVLRLPREMRPRGGVPRRLSTAVANVDVVPTILGLARAEPCSGGADCRILDGRSMLRAIRSDGERWPKRRGILLELRTPRQRAVPFTPCAYRGLRTPHRVYVEYRSATLGEGGECIRRDETEHYDLASDPFQLDNLFPAPPGSHAAVKERSLAARLARLRDCAGIAGRDPTPPSGHYCE